MVSINGVPSPQTTRSNQSQRAANKQKATRKQTPKTTQVANAVRQRVDPVSVAQAEQAQQQVQYDLPDGRGRQAMESYFAVLNQTRREELLSLVGVDIYV
ncbi:hypothetical protein BZG78_12315 [Salinivibrio sp. MA351]|jgi:cytoskeletal protein RodZ|uniref:Chromosome partitioning protein ParA n=1 Tax=Salinivibrio costicola subsp. alcaliphilus TaxID=272773 RepID=A0ABX3KUF9_SALCS|nr:MULTISPECIES: hypothetical protein [Salinivibrio]NUY55530.1 chromosome partitioning protein ParA [Salinivibrio sp. EAGSL]OOE93792.1 hypothetical protein BZG76_03525 [Salinivibrio sp. AR647]OOE95837.1 hypothetical protein BZG75_00405 [Salinivibrio sp. AR640]OOE97168.1 hypothetical protein BZG78_12315 [Salinivibrio sp. MA351]OOF04934.1 hypothetical protein BZG80_07050 [Salinivibrio sp. MA440]